MITGKMRTNSDLARELEIIEKQKEEQDKVRSASETVEHKDKEGNYSPSSYDNDSKQGKSRKDLVTLELTK